jgi:hypothetical protein
LSEAGQPASSSFDSILDECLSLFAERLRAALAGMLDKADASLAELIGGTQNRDQQKIFQEARKVAAAQRRAFESKFNESFLAEFQKHVGKLKGEAQSFGDIEVSLSLVEDTDLEEALKYKEAAAKMRKFCDEELGALDQRVGVLLGDANLSAEANPFGPESIGEAYQNACKALETDAKVREVMLKLFDDHVVDEVRSIYKAVNALLVKNAILPKIRYGVIKKPEGKSAKEHGGEEDDEEDAGKAEEAEAPSEANIFAMLQNLVAKGGGLGGGGGGGGGGVQLPPGAVILQGAELVGSLNNIQARLQALSLGEAGAALPEGVSQAAASGRANVLKELKATTFGAQMQGVDAATLDIVSMLFDQLFDDPKIPAALKGLIGRLQIPMLKVAIADKALFSKKSHPARLLLDTFGEVAVRLAEDFTAESPTFVHLEAIVQHLVANFQEDIGVFERAREQLKEVIAGHDKQIEEAVQAETKRIEEQENLSAAKTAAEEEVKERVQAHKLPGPVLEFLIQEWLRYLLVLYAKGGRGSADWQGALETMDQLIASLEPVKTLEDRKKLAASVPALVRKLVVGMNAVGTEPPAREAFLGELMKYHTVSLAKVKEGAPPPPPPPAPVAAPPEALDFSAPVTVPNPSGGGSVNVVSLGLDFTGKPVDKTERAKAKAALMSSLAVDPPAKMEMGSWVEFRPKEEGAEPRAAKVLFVSPKKTRYLFSDRRGKEVLELSRAEIVRRLRSGEAVRLEHEPAEPLFERFMHGVMGKLKSPAATPG